MVLQNSINSRKRPASGLTGTKWAEATSFIRDVRSAFMHLPSPNNYERFLVILREFKSCSLPLVECFKLIGALFKDTPHLIPPFNVFAPNGYRLEHRDGRIFVLHKGLIHEVPEDILQTYSYLFNPANLPTALTANPRYARGGFDQNTI